MVLGADMRLASLDFGMRAGPVRIQATGRVVPEGLELKVDIGGQPGERVLPMAEAPVFDLTLPYLLARQDLQPGDRYRVSVFDPQTLSNREAVVEVVGPEAVPDESGRLVPAMHLRRRAAGLALDSWVDARGRVYREQMEGGLTLVRTDREQATRDVVGLPAEQLDGPGGDFLRGLVQPKIPKGAAPP